ncbi:MAG: DUF2017 domain-containing protein [Microbacteriaceae bacterium]
MIPFERDSTGVITASFSQPESSLLASLAGQVASMLDSYAAPPAIDDPDAAALYASVGLGGSSSLSDDPAIARLLPDAYSEADASADFRGLTERSLATRKVANARAVAQSLSDADTAAGDVRLTEQEAQAWLRTLADLRLTIAARLGIEHDGDEGGDDESSVALKDVYDWLAWVTESLIDAIES